MMIDLKQLVATKANEVLRKLLADSNLRQHIWESDIPAVFMEATDPTDIRLITLGQDPTIRNEQRRKEIRTVLTLDENQGNLYKYLNKICEGIGLSISQHMYATNLIKNFLKQPLTEVENSSDVLDKLTYYWLPLLQEELSYFPGIPVLTLGEPMLRQLLTDKSKARVREYWGYVPDWKERAPTDFSCVVATENVLGRVVFPFPHQPSLQKGFYRATLTQYLSYMKNTLAYG